MSLLPTEKSHPSPNLSDYTVLLYGATKIGKSTFCSNAPDAVFLSTEPGLNALSVYQVPIRNWEELLTACGELAAGNHGFKTVIIDTIDNAYKMCSEFIVRKHQVDHESDLSYGKGFSLVNGEFQRVINKLAFLPYGLYLISHAQEIEVKTRTGDYNKTVPTLPDKARKIILGLVDMVLYCDLEVTTDQNNQQIVRRIIRTKPHLNYEAGDRTKRLPDVIPLDYSAFASAFGVGAAAPAKPPAAAAKQSSTPIITSAASAAKETK